MLLERVGIRIELTAPGDIAYFKSLGWTEVKEAAPVAASTPPQEPKAEEATPEARPVKTAKKKAGE